MAGLPPKLPAGLVAGQPLTALAPMQDVTDLAFMGLLGELGAPDYFYTEFFRVHSMSTPEKHIVRSIDENKTGRPIFAQMIGEDIQHLVRTARELQKHPIAALDLNLGCPAPKVYKKNVGGGLLREPEKVGEILRALREAIPGVFTVKMRIGFDSDAPFERILQHVAEAKVDLLTVHGRTVKEMYRSEVHYDLIAKAAASVPCPVLANGNVTSAAKAVQVVAETKVAGVMIGRHAIRNPWIFEQCRDAFAGRPVRKVTLKEVRTYIAKLYQATTTPGIPEWAHVAKMKKYLNFVGQGVDPQGAFLYAMRRAASEADLFKVCDEHLLKAEGAVFSDEPYPGVIARPNCETPAEADGCSLETVSA